MPPAAGPTGSEARARDGWAFWWRFVLATNASWFPGIALGLAATDRLGLGDTAPGALLAAAVAGLAFGGGQAWSLRATLGAMRGWWLACALGWPAGVALAETLRPLVGLPRAGIVDTIATATIAGAVLGGAQALVLRGRLRGAALWPLISAAGWGVLFPGALPGLALVWLDRRGHPTATAGEASPEARASRGPSSPGGP